MSDTPKRRVGFIGRLTRLVVLLFLAAGWTLAAAAVHVIRTPGELPVVGKILVIPKERLTFREAYVDTTAWTAEDVSRHPAIVHRLKELDRLDVLRHVDATLPVERISSAE